jgi:hypothetical protein
MEKHMIIKSLEFVQGRDIHAVNRLTGTDVSILDPGREYVVSQVFGAWLLENRKAEEIKPAKYIGAQPEPELRHDEEIEPVAIEVEQPAPVMTTSHKRGRK